MQNVFDSMADAIRILREVTLLRLLKHDDMVGIKHILLPSDPTTYKDLYIVYELMEASGLLEGAIRPCAGCGAMGLDPCVPPSHERY